MGAGGYIEYGRVNGNLALSRALGDFEFKKNYSLSAEKQVITADPDVLVHDLTDEDEFLIIACDGMQLIALKLYGADFYADLGIWDCLSNQQAVDFVRLKVSEGKELTEIGEDMCELCLAPDTSSGAGIGCDNMTVLIVALMYGRTKEEWYSWVTDRVKQNYGYETPKTLPQIYAQSRLMAFKARREAQQERDRTRADRDETLGGFMGASAFGGFARVLGSTGGMTFHPGGGISGGGLMFGNDDSDDDDDDMDVDPGRSFFSDTLGIGGPRSPDVTSSLKAQLDDFEKEIRDDDFDGDGLDEENEGPFTPEEEHEPSELIFFELEEHDAYEDSGTHPARELQGEAPPPPVPHPDGDTEPVEQLPKPLPDSETPSAAVIAEGLSDKSEDPTIA